MEWTQHFGGSSSLSGFALLDDILSWNGILTSQFPHCPIKNIKRYLEKTKEADFIDCQVMLPHFKTLELELMSKLWNLL